MIRILKCGEVAADDIFARVTPKVDVEAVVADIIATVREQGDKALFAYTAKFDGATLDSL
ncbi:MAG: histidinol dehydrogenase, partial [Clostridia bacterium]|nr:histidinol dehydrogenase [Clostridia bacterium]